MASKKSQPQTGDYVTELNPQAYIANREITNLPGKFLVKGSQNVLIKNKEKVVTRKGYTVLGATKTVAQGIISAFDWATNPRRFSLRGWGNTTQTLEVWYNNSWTTLMSGLIAAEINFTTWWDTQELAEMIGFVNGDGNIYRWSGGAALYASCSNAGGIVSQISGVPYTAGSGYAVGDIVNITGGGGTGAQAKVASITNYAITSISVTTNGQFLSQYPFAVGMVLGFSVPSAGIYGATAKVATIDGSGGVATLTLINQGTATPLVAGTYTGVAMYYTAGNVPTGCVATVVVGSSVGGIATLTFLTPGSGYAVGNNLATTASTGVGTGATINITGISANSLTVQGTQAVNYLGFHIVESGAITINGKSYAYTGFLNQTFFNLSSNPVADNIPANSVILQTVDTVPFYNAATTSTNFNASAYPPIGFAPNLISTYANYVFYGSTVSRKVYMSTNTFYNTFNYSNTRVPGEGMDFLLDSSSVAFIPGESFIRISAGTDDVYVIEYKQTTVTSSGVALITEAVTTKKEKTATGQGARSQGSIIPTPNAVAYISNEPSVLSFGNVPNYLDSPQNVPISDPIRDDIESYNLTGCHGKYFRRNMYVTLPYEQKVLIFDMLKTNMYWQPPQIIAGSKLAVIFVNGVPTLCLHSAGGNETYILDSGYNDNGAPFKWIAAFGYENYGSRFGLKVFDEIAVEMYLSATTKVTDRVVYDYLGATAIRDFPIDPSDPANAQCLFLPVQAASLGSNPEGSMPLGSSNPEINPIPKFRIINETTVVDFIERQRIFFGDSIDSQCQILAYGENVQLSENEPTYLRH